MEELVCKAVIAAVDDAGLEMTDVDGFAYFAGGHDTSLLTEILGIPEVRFTATLTGAGGGSAGALGLAASAIVGGLSKTVVVVCGVQQAIQRYGTYSSAYPSDPYNSFYLCSGLVSPGQAFALIARKHMQKYGTTREHFAEVAMAIRANALRNPGALMQKPMSKEDYFAAPMIADPHCLFDFCLESDGAVAAVVTSAERAKDLRQKPAYILASTQGGEGEWGRSLYWFNMPDELFTTSGHRSVARQLYEMAGVGPKDIDCAQIYDHFTSQVIMQLEDYGFCTRGEGGAFVASGAIRSGGALPINTDGGQLSCAYIWGMSHVKEAVEQIRGTAVNQVKDAELVLVTGGPSNIPMSGLILRR
jgi:acetyl-CoA acetyltransferase